MIGADVIASSLAGLGVRHVFGVGGANIEDTYLAVQRRRPRMLAILNKHEHSAGTAADAYSRVSRSLGVVMTTSGGGAMNLVPALAESLASRVPVLAIVGEPPTSHQGRGAFQDTSGSGGSVDAQAVFRSVSAWCRRASCVEELSALIDEAARTARASYAPAVLLVAKDVQQAPAAAVEESAPGAGVPQAAPSPDGAAIRAAVRMLERRPVVIVAGDEVVRAGARGDLARLAVALDARVTVTPDARDAFDNGDPRFAGVTGAMGHESATRALTDARVCLLLGTRLPLLARMGQEAILAARPLVSIAREAPFVAAADSLHVGGDLEINLRALVSELDEGTREAAVPTGIAARLASEDRPGPAGSFGSEDVLAAAERALPDAGVVLVDAGGTGAHAVHHVRAPRGGHWLVAMGMAGMGYTFGAAIGAALATGRRVLVLAGDGAFFMHGLEVHTAVQHRLPITYVIFNNKAHGMCLMRERLLLGEEGGYNAFLTSHIGGGLAAMFPGLPASDCSTIGELEAALGRARAVSGPAVVCAELPTVEVPPFAALRAALGGRRPAVNPSAPK